MMGIVDVIVEQKKIGYKGSKNNSVLEKGIVFVTWMIRTGCEMIFSTVTWIGKLIISIFSLSFTVTRESVRRIFRLIRLPEINQNRHRATVRNGRLRYEYYG